MAGRLFLFWLGIITLMAAFASPGHAGTGENTAKENITWGHITFTPAEDTWLAQRHKIRVRISFTYAGCDDFVKKPFPENDIFEIMGKHLGIRYIYEDPLTDDGQKPSSVYIPKPDDLAVMSDEWRTAFSDASIVGDPEKCLELIEQIPSDHAELAGGLKQLLREFAFEKLITLT